MIDLEDYLSRPGSDERFIQKRLEWRITYSLQRTDFALGLFDGERSQRTTATGDPLDDTSQRGADASIGYRLGAKTDLRLRASFARRELNEGEEREIIRALARANYRLGPRTDLSLEYEYVEEDGDAGSAAGSYVTNTVTLLLTRSF